MSETEYGPRHGGMANGQCGRGWAERCAQATGATCRCSCGGVNHGKARRWVAPSAHTAGMRSGASAPDGAYRVGDVVTVGKPCMGNAPGTRAVCYEVYPRADGEPGVSLIFPNGNYDGFSRRDLTLFAVTPVGHCLALASYKFVNVSRLWLDWQRGTFKQAWDAC